MSTNSAADLKALRASTLLGAVGLLMLSAAGCAKPLLSLDASTPPLILVPLPHAGVVDGRGRFREIYGAIREDHGRELPDDRPVAEALHQLANEPAATGVPVHLGPARTPLRFAFVPGLFGECVQDSVGLFSYAREHVEEHGYRTDIIVVSGRSSSEHNAGQIREAVMAAEPAPAERLVLVGYSKGAVDSLTAVTEHPEIRDRVAAVVSICGPIGGSPIADGLDGLLLDLLENLNVPGCPVGDGGAIDSLRRSTRQAWLAEHELPGSIRYYSVAAFADRRNTSSILQSNYDQLAMIDPRNDSQVIFSDAVIPGGTLLGYVNVDHWGAAMPFSRDLSLASGTVVDRTAFPREVLLEAVIRFVEEDFLTEGEMRWSAHK
ncbi:MAG: esterase/lipase family protein [Planctomycetota bacterium]